MENDFELQEIINTIHIMFDMDAQEDGTDIAADYTRYSKEELERQGFGEAQIEEIRNGIAQRLPVRQYAKSCYNWKQMKEIRLGLMDGLEIDKYENPLFCAGQMREIRLGLRDKLDISAYAHLIFSAKDMAGLRKDLLSEAYANRSAGYAKVTFDEESGALIRISDDCMQAFVKLTKKGSYTVQELTEILRRNDVVYGIREEQLAKAIEGQGGEEEILAAEGKAALAGADGRYEYFFNPLLPEKPKINADGSADYTQVAVADRREAGEPLAQYYPAEKGTDGETVTGIVIKGIRGREKKVLRGQGIIRDEKKNLYTARISGYVVVNEEEGSLNVWNVLFINGDINRYNGNISYDGMIHIRGSVSDMVQIEAAGSVVVDGYVEGAHIKAGENIILRSGMNGGGRGVLEAGGSVAGNFFEGASIYAGGNVEGNYFLNCNVVTDKSLIAKGKRSRIMGGKIRAGYAVETCSVMKSGKTVIEVGNPQWLEERLKRTDEMLEKVREEGRQLAEGKEKILGLFGEKAGEKNALFHKICIALDMKQEEEKLLSGEKERLEYLIKKARYAYIKIYGKVQEDVILAVCGNAKRVEKDISGVSMFKTEGI